MTNGIVNLFGASMSKTNNDGVPDDAPPAYASIAGGITQADVSHAVVSAVIDSLPSPAYSLLNTYLEHDEKTPLPEYSAPDPDSELYKYFLQGKAEESIERFPKVLRNPLARLRDAISDGIRRIWIGKIIDIDRASSGLVMRKGGLKAIVADVMNGIMKRVASLVRVVGKVTGKDLGGAASIIEQVGAKYAAHVEYGTIVQEKRGVSSNLPKLRKPQSKGKARY